MEFKGNSFIEYPLVFKEEDKGKGKRERKKEKNIKKVRYTPQTSCPRAVF